MPQNKVSDDIKHVTLSTTNGVLLIRAVVLFVFFFPASRKNDNS